MGRVDGGRFFIGDIVEVKRIDVFDFKVNISDADFNQLSAIADNLRVSIEVAFALIIANGIDSEIEALVKKE